MTAVTHDEVIGLKFKIGFAQEEQKENKTPMITHVTSEYTISPRKSVVQVHFPEKNKTLAYYNDRFDLHCGDIVYVDGKLEGHRGRVVEVNYNFKIKLSDYKRVIAVVDTDVKGRFYMAGSHMVSFDVAVIPKHKVIRWFLAPTEEEEYVTGSGDSSFYLDDLSKMNVSLAVAERGHEYYMENKVRYICVDGTQGYAIVEGGEAYEVEFTYKDGEISDLTCSCYCSYNCKHEFAAMLQLKESLELIEKHYSKEYEQSGYFAAVYKPTLFAFAINGKEQGSFTLS